MRGNVANNIITDLDDSFGEKLATEDPDLLLTSKDSPNETKSTMLDNFLLDQTDISSSGPRDIHNIQ